MRPAAQPPVRRNTFSASQATSLKTPGGMWSIDLGVLSAPSACLALPASAHFYIINAGTNDTTTITWTASLGLSLGALQPQDSRLMASPSTAAFIPASALGWRATLPGGTQVSPAGPC